MADTLIQTVAEELETPSEEYLDPQPEPEIGSSSLNQRRIEFHLARKPFNGLINGGGGDFKLETLNPSTSSTSDSRKLGSLGHPGQLGSKKVDGSEFLENGLDPELRFGITFRRIGAGLSNLGNTCYLNSVLQCLTYTEPLAAYLQSGRHRNSCHVAGFCALCAIQKHVSLALQSTGKILVPKELVINLRCISRNFTKARQEDAHEYMVNLLESMHKCCLPSGVPSESPSAYEKSLVHKIFGGRLRSQVKCLQCSYSSNKFDPFLDLSLEILKAESLQKALVNFTAAEQLDGGERQYHCQRCNQKVRALKQMTVHKPPYVLSIHLKRFRAHDPGRKIDRHVKFGPTLDLRPFVSDSYEGDLKYTLYGVLVHCGATTYSGHYYCYVRTSTGIWYSLDDKNVYQVSERIVLEQKAYMLFYVRDRRNIVPRKPVEVAQKENFSANSAGFKNRSVNNQCSKELVQNVSVESGSSGLSSCVVTEKDASTIVPPMVPRLKDGSVKSQKTAENVVPMKVTVSESFPKVSLSKGAQNGLSFPKPKLGKDMPQSSPLPSSNGGASNPQIAKAATTDANKNDLSERGSSIENSGVSTVMSTNVKDPESLEAAKPIRDEISRNSNIVSCVGDLRTGSSEAPGGIKMEGIHTVKSSVQPSSEISQDGGFTNDSAAGNFLGEKAVDCLQKVLVDESVKLSESSIVTNGSLHVKAPDCKHHRKLKKKQMKSTVTCMHFRPSLLSRAVLSVQKKKHKRSKHPTSDTKSLSKESLSELGPSTSEKTRSISSVSTLSKRKSKRKGTKSGLKKDADGAAKKRAVKSRSDSVMAAENGDSRESIGQNGTVLASDKCLQNDCSSSSCSMVNQKETGGTDSPRDYKREKIQNGWMSVPTRVLHETVVAHWDGIELPPPHIVESSHAKGNVSIGYIPDEWDEEYDRGKRKKVRQSKHTSGGPNPFQRVATERSQLKKARLGRFDSGNQPLRI